MFGELVLFLFMPFIVITAQYVNANMIMSVIFFQFINSEWQRNKVIECKWKKKKVEKEPELAELWPKIELI